MNESFKYYKNMTFTDRMIVSNMAIVWSAVLILTSLICMDHSNFILPFIALTLGVIWLVVVIRNKFRIKSHYGKEQYTVVDPKK